MPNTPGQRVIVRPRKGKPMVVIISNKMAMKDTTKAKKSDELKEKMLEFFAARSKVEKEFPRHTVLMFWATTHSMNINFESPEFKQPRFKNCLVLERDGFPMFHHLCAHRYLQE
eukprot:TRINITY_DN1588_c0_g1_i1.p2 TRINITY_DN1588_c0_g1~~TRINITY_DN1588_c0_g1_i1.p2  ORF type:complete len:114 (+),score=29.93 TRINITY_DN1588_c0_g1_i1:257-598(+)